MSTWLVWHDPDGQTFYASQDADDPLAQVLGFEFEPQMLIAASSRYEACSKAVAEFDRRRKTT